MSDDVLEFTPEVMKEYTKKFTEYNLVINKMNSLGADLNNMRTSFENLKMRNHALEDLAQLQAEQINRLQEKVEAMEELLEDTL